MLRLKNDLIVTKNVTGSFFKDNELQLKFSALLVCCKAEFVAEKCVCGDWFPTRKNRTSTALLAGKVVLIMILLAGKKESYSWELDKKRGLAGRWKQLCLSQQVKKFNC